MSNTQRNFNGAIAASTSESPSAARGFISALKALAISALAIFGIYREQPTAAPLPAPAPHKPPSETKAEMGTLAAPIAPTPLSIAPMQAPQIATHDVAVALQREKLTVTAPAPEKQESTGLAGAKVITLLENALSSENTVIDACDLHLALNSREGFTRWFRKQVVRFSLVEGHHFFAMQATSKRRKYVLRADIAKAITLKSNTEAGREALAFFTSMDVIMNPLDLSNATPLSKDQQALALAPARTEAEPLPFVMPTAPDGMNLWVLDGEFDGVKVKYVVARELHACLGIGKDFSNWTKAQIKRAQLDENKDFFKFAQKGELSATGQTTIEYMLTIEAAKHIAMVSGTPRGKEVRQFFIQCEQALLAHLTVASNREAADGDYAALVAEYQTLHSELDTVQSRLAKIVEVVAAKQPALPAPTIAPTGPFVETENVRAVQDVAKILGTHSHALFPLLRDWGLVFKHSTLPCHEYVKRGILVTRDRPFKKDGVPCSEPTTYVTPAGVEFIQKRYAKHVAGKA